MNRVDRLAKSGIPSTLAMVGHRRYCTRRQAGAALLGFLACLSGLAHADTVAPKPAQAEAGANQRNALPAAGGANAITQAAVRTGILNCAGRINQVTNFLGGGSTAGAVLFAPPGPPDQRLATLSMEVKSGATNSYVSASFAPNQANGCGAAYDAVTWWPESCEAVGSRHFGTLKKIGLLQHDITALDGGPATKVFLMPAGKGCVSIKKEVVL